MLGKGSRETSGGFQSGQMGQTVNLVAQPSQVQILLRPPVLRSQVPAGRSRGSSVSLFSMARFDYARSTRSDDGVCVVERVELNGIAPAVQAGGEGSIPFTRSRIVLSSPVRCYSSAGRAPPW